jgi:hypothetical protein
MKRLRLHRLLLLLLLMVAIVHQKANAQGSRKDKVEALRIAFFTKELDLNAKEAQLFWPVYNEYQDKLEANRKQRRKDARDSFSSGIPPDDKEAENIINSEIAFRQRELDLQKQYLDRIKGLIGASKTARLLKAEEDFKKELIKKLRDN